MLHAHACVRRPISGTLRLVIRHDCFSAFKLHFTTLAALLNAGALTMLFHPKASDIRNNPLINMRV